MPLWGNSDDSANAVKYVAQGGVNATGANLYQNVTSGSWVTGEALGVFAVNDIGTTNTAGQGGVIGSPGWAKVTQGTGPVTGIAANAVGGSYANLALGSISNGTVRCDYFVTVNATGNVQTITVANAGFGFINATALTTTALPANGIATFTIGGGSAYANGELVTVSNGQVNATGYITTNATGGIASIAFGAPYYAGRGFAAANSTASVVAITTVAGVNGNVVANSIGGGSGLTLVPTLGGRAGRQQYEVLAALGSITVTANSTFFRGV